MQICGFRFRAVFVKTRDQILPRLVGGLLLVLVALTSAPAVFAQTGAAEADEVIVSPLPLVPVDDLSFGNLFPGLFRIASTDGITLRIGATLDLGSSQQTAVYEATFPVTMNYF